MPGLFKKETTSTTLISAALIKLATLFQEGYRNSLVNTDSILFAFRTNEMRLNVTKILDRIAKSITKIIYTR